MKRFCGALALGISMLVFAGTASALDPASVGPLKKLMDEGGQAHSLGQVYGLESWLLVQGADQQVAYTTPDGQALLVGFLFGPDGEDVNAKQLEAAKAKNPELAKLTPAPKVDAAAPKSERVIAEAEAARWIVLGDASAPVLYVLSDPLCSYCRAQLLDLIKPANEGRVQVRIIPVGALSEDSLKIAQQILSSPDPSLAWVQHLQGKDVALARVELKPEAQGDLLSNMRFMERWGLTGTPFSFYRGSDGKVKVISGQPSSVEAILSDLKKN